MTDYKYQYFQFAGDPEFKIHTDWGYEISEIKKNIISQTPDSIIYESEYPNGFKILVEQTAGSFMYRTNKPLIQNVDGSFSVDLNA